MYVTSIYLAGVFVLVEGFCYSKQVTLHYAASYHTLLILPKPAILGITLATKDVIRIDLLSVNDQAVIKQQSRLNTTLSWIARKLETMNRNWHWPKVTTLNEVGV